MNSTMHNVGDDLESISTRIKEGIRRGRFTLAELQTAMSSRTRQAAETTDEYVHEHTWKALGIAAGAGLITGLLLSRGGEEETAEMVEEEYEEAHAPASLFEGQSVWDIFQTVLPLAVLTVKTVQELRARRR